MFICVRMIPKKNIRNSPRQHPLAYPRQKTPCLRVEGLEVTTGGDVDRVSLVAIMATVMSFLGTFYMPYIYNYIYIYYIHRESHKSAQIMISIPVHELCWGFPRSRSTAPGSKLSASLCFLRTPTTSAVRPWGFVPAQRGDLTWKIGQHFSNMDIRQWGSVLLGICEHIRI